MTRAFRLRAEWFPNIRAGILAGTVAALALVMVTLVREHGLQYLLAAPP